MDTMLTPEGISFGNVHDWDAVRCHHATPHTAKPIVTHRILLASRSDSNKVRMSPSPAGPVTFLMICRFCFPKNSTLTWVHCPCEPVHPSTFITLIPQVYPFCTHRPTRAKQGWLDSISDRPVRSESLYRLRCPEFESLLTKNIHIFQWRDYFITKTQSHTRVSATVNPPSGCRE